MELYEKINIIIKEKGITKRTFSTMLRNLEPKLKSTGEVPTEKTIYKYLSGDINIPIELIPYIADALDVIEQELFGLHPQSKRKLIKYISNQLDATQLSYAKGYEEKVNTFTTFHQNEIENIIKLLEYAPKSMLDKLYSDLKTIKKISLSSNYII